MHQEKLGSPTIIIVGAGLSGLTVADQILTQFSPNSSTSSLKAIVLQAMDRVGGRTLTVEVEGAKFDLGGQWVGKTQKYAQALAERSKNQLYDQYHKGTKILDLYNKISFYETNIPLNVGILPLLQLQTLIWKVDRMAKKVNIKYPNQCNQALYWDSITVHTWMRENIYSEKVKKLLQCSIRAVFGVEADQMSFLFFLWYIHQSCGIQNLINIQNGLQQKKMAHGSQHLSDYLKEQILKKGGEVVTDCYVKSISKISEDSASEKYQVVDRQGRKFYADYLVMALPPSCVRKINFYPILSRQRRLICDRSLMGSISKVILIYEQAYWKQKGFSGETLSDCIETPIFNAYDDCRTKSNGQIQPAILVFINASVDREWSSDRQKAEKSIRQRLAQYFKDQRMLLPKSIHWKVWCEEESISGGPISVFPPGVLTKIQDIRKPQGNIHWAGTQMADVSQGFMDGAIQSGQRCAQEILAKLENAKNPQPINTRARNVYNKIIQANKKLLDWF